MDPNIYRQILDYITQEGEWSNGIKCCMPLSARESSRSAASFLGTTGREYWSQTLLTRYEGEVDCDTGKPYGFGRLFVEDEAQNWVHHYAGFFVDSHIPIFY